MHPRIAELVNHLDATRAALRLAIESVPPERRPLVPASGGWSANGVLEHLVMAESRIAGLLSKKIADARAAGVGNETETAPIFASLGTETLLDRSVKIEAPEAIQPKEVRDFETVWAALEEARVRFKQVLRDADGFAFREITHPHPVFGPIDGYKWIAFLGSHEARHAAQIREIGALLDEA
jgi:uncharacterized damage-inducible protein DinB